MLSRKVFVPDFQSWEYYWSVIVLVSDKDTTSSGWRPVDSPSRLSRLFSACHRVISTVHTLKYTTWAVWAPIIHGISAHSLRVDACMHTKSPTSLNQSLQTLFISILFFDLFIFEFFEFFSSHLPPCGCGYFGSHFPSLGQHPLPPEPRDKFYRPNTVYVPAAAARSW